MPIFLCLEVLLMLCLLQSCVNHMLFSFLIALYDTSVFSFMTFYDINVFNFLLIPGSIKSFLSFFGPMIIANSSHVYPAKWVEDIIFSFHEWLLPGVV